MLFRRKQAPQYLYKFVSSRTAALILEGHSVSSTAFQALNDPFECLTVFMYSDPPSRWAAIAAYGAVKEGSAVLPDEIHEWQMDDWSARRDLVEKLGTNLETIGVFCLTEDARNLLM
jgi:hypothetical protein